MNTSTFIDFIKARWRIIAISVVIVLVVILTILNLVVGLFVLPAEITSSSGAIAYNNSTGITESLK
jgi:hypothetical protein